MRNFGVNSSPRRAFRGRTTGRTGCSGSTARNPSYNNRQVQSLREIGPHRQNLPTIYPFPIVTNLKHPIPALSDPKLGCTEAMLLLTVESLKKSNFLQTAERLFQHADDAARSVLLSRVFRFERGLESPLKPFGKNDHPIAIGIEVGDVSRRHIAALLIKATRRLVFRCVRGFNQQHPATARLDVAFCEL